MRAGIVALLVSASLLACDDGSDRETGIEELDTVIAIVESGDRAAVRDAIQLSTQPCTTALGAGGPPKCEPGETDGDIVEVFRYVGCEPGWLRVGSLDGTLDEAFAHSFRLYAAYESNGDAEAVFQATDSPTVGAGISVTVVDGNILALRRTCGAGDDAGDLIPEGQQSFLVEPLNSD